MSVCQDQHDFFQTAVIFARALEDNETKGRKEDLKLLRNKWYLVNYQLRSHFIKYHVLYRILEKCVQVYIVILFLPLALYAFCITVDVLMLPWDGKTHQLIGFHTVVVDLVVFYDAQQAEYMFICNPTTYFHVLQFRILIIVEKFINSF